MDATFLRGRRVARETTLPIRNVPMAVLVGLDSLDEEVINEYTVHEIEAMAALSRFRSMHAATRNAMAWQAIKQRLIDARLQLTVGLTRDEALALPTVCDLLVAEEVAICILRGLRTPPALCRCDDVMRSARVLISVIREEAS